MRWRSTGTATGFPLTGPTRAVTSDGATGSWFSPWKRANAIRVSPTANCGAAVSWTDKAFAPDEDAGVLVFFAHAHATAPRPRTPALRRKVRRSMGSISEDA